MEVFTNHGYTLSVKRINTNLVEITVKEGQRKVVYALEEKVMVAVRKQFEDFIELCKDSSLSRLDSFGLEMDTSDVFEEGDSMFFTLICSIGTEDKGVAELGKYGREMRIKFQEGREKGYYFHLGFSELVEVSKVIGVL